MCTYAHVYPRTCAPVYTWTEDYFQGSLLPFQHVGPRIELDSHEGEESHRFSKRQTLTLTLGTFKMAVFFLTLLTLDKNLAS